MKPCHNQLNAPVVFRCLAFAVLALPINAGAQNAPSTRPAIDPYKLLAGPDVGKEQQEVRQELENVLDAAREPLDEAAAHLALANWHLAIPTARSATRWILGLDRLEDRKALADSAAAARKHISQAEPLLKKGEASGEKARRKRLATDTDTLKAFADVFAATEITGNDASRRETWSEAASGLSEARESENAQVASAATLWQAMAWNQAGRAQRALTTLPDALAKPDQPYDFMARILRCRILSDQRQPAAALALCTQIRSRIGDWYPRERTAHQQARERLVGLLELQIGQAWIKRLQAGTHPADAELLEGILAEVKQSLFAKEDTSLDVYVPSDAIPILAKAPAVKPLSTEPASQPATRSK